MGTNPGAPMHFLDKVQLAYSCPLAWEKLVGGETRRFCGDCQKHVTNLSAMSRPAAEAWVARNHDVSVCVRVEVDAQGRSLHRPAFRATALAALSLGAAACTTDEGFDSGAASSLASPRASHAFRNAAREHAAALEEHVQPVAPVMGEMPAMPQPERVMMGAPPRLDDPEPAPEVRPLMGRRAPPPDVE